MLENVVGSREEGWNTNIFYAIFDESVFYRFYDETAPRSFGNPRRREVHPEELHPITVFSCIKRTSKVTLESILANSMLELKDNNKFVVNGFSTDVNFCFSSYYHTSRVPWLCLGSVTIPASSFWICLHSTMLLQKNYMMYNIPKNWDRCPKKCGCKGLRTPGDLGKPP